MPALLYFVLNAGGEGAAGWGIPMATDIAFAMGAMALLGNRVPLGLKVFLTALAIVDDIVAVMVIAIVYTESLSWPSLAVAVGFFAALLGASKFGVRHSLAFALLGVCMWIAMLFSGVHATIASVLAALAVPARPRIEVKKFIAHGRQLLDQMEYPDKGEEHILRSEARQVAVLALEDACEKVKTPLQRFEHTLLPWVRLMIMPLFAFANARVALGTSTALAATSTISLGIVFGLVVGKPIASCAPPG
jgi:NhaA family Na+:H+ antiporter